MRPAGITALTCVALTKVVARAVLLKDATAPLRNPVPVTVRVNPGPPAVVDDGDMDVMVGVGGAMVNARVLEMSRPSVAITDADPGCAIRLADTVAVSWVALT